MFIPVYAINCDLTDNSWFSAALGRLPQITATTSADPFLRTLKCDGANESFLVQTNLARLGVIVCTMLEHIHGTQRAEVGVYDKYITALDNWISALPPALRFHTNHQDSENSQFCVGDRSAMVSIQCFFAEFFSLTLLI